MLYVINEIYAKLSYLIKNFIINKSESCRRKENMSWFFLFTRFKSKQKENSDIVWVISSEIILYQYIQNY